MKKYLKHTNKNRTFFILTLLINRRLSVSSEREIYPKEGLKYIR